MQPTKEGNLLVQQQQEQKSICCNQVVYLKLKQVIIEGRMVDALPHFFQV